MKTLKQLHVEYVSDLLLTEMEKEITCLYSRCEEVAGDRSIPFCYARKSIKKGIERYSILLNRFTRLINKYPIKDGYEHNLTSFEKSISLFYDVRYFYYDIKINKTLKYESLQ